jgi:hypothetical protein
MANESLISVPSSFKSFVELRYFLVRLVIKIDELTGTRAGDPAALSTDVNVAIQQLNQQINSLTITLQSFATNQAAEAESNANDYTDLQIDLAVANLEQTVEADLSQTVVTVSAGYVQAEVQQIANNVLLIADKVDNVLAKLRLAGIIAV